MPIPVTLDTHSSPTRHHCVSGCSDDSVPFGEFDLSLTLTADYFNNLGELDSYTKQVPFSIDVSLNQVGFPISTADFNSIKKGRFSKKCARSGWWLRFGEVR